MTDNSSPEASEECEEPTEKLPAPSETEEMIHSLGTPLTIISGYVQLLRRRNRRKAGLDDAALERSLQAIEGAVDRMKDIVAEHRSAHPDHDGDTEGPASP